QRALRWRSYRDRLKLNRRHINVVQLLRPFLIGTVLSILALGGIHIPRHFGNSLVRELCTFGHREVRAFVLKPGRILVVDSLVTTSGTYRRVFFNDGLLSGGFFYGCLFYGCLFDG